MVYAEVIQRTLLIEGKTKGTGFCLDFEKRQYIVTCRHVTEGMDPKVYWKGKFCDVGMTLVGQQDKDPILDLAVFAADGLIADPSLEMSIHPVAGVHQGQELWFCGYPWGLHQNHPTLNRGLPTPFVRRSVLSAFGNQDDKTLFYLDGINNQGFSGGPVVTTSGQRNQVVAVVLAMEREKLDVVDTDDENKIVAGLSALGNSGFTLARPINVALELIQSNPIGVPVDSAG